MLQALRPVGTGDPKTHGQDSSADQESRTTPARGNPPHLFRDAYEIARRGGLGVTVHAGEDEGPEFIWEAIDLLGADRIGASASVKIVSGESGTSSKGY